MNTYKDLKQEHIKTYKQEVEVMENIFNWFNANNKIHPKYYDPFGVDLPKGTRN